MKKIKAIPLSIILAVVTQNSFGLTYSQKKYEFLVNENSINMNYQWFDQNKRPNNINFSVDKLEVAKSYIDFKRPESKIMTAFVYEKLKEDTDLINNSQSSYKIEIIKPNDYDREFAFKVTGDFDDLLMSRLKNVLDKRQDEYQEEFYKKSYYIWNEDIRLISIDYQRITENYIDKMTPVANAFKNKNNRNIYDRRSVINDILNFYQSIPYDTLLENRGAGFSTPLKLLHENKGDCDTKLVAIASTLKNLYPDMKIIAIVLPKHVLLGFNSPYTREDLKIMHKGLPYVLAESAGPGLIPLGQISEDTAALMRLGLHKVLEL